MISLLDESQLDVVISLTGFVATFLAVACIMKLVKHRTWNTSEDNDVVINSVLCQFVMKLENLVTSVQQIKMRLDLVEAKSNTPIAVTSELACEIKKESSPSQIQSLMSTERGPKTVISRKSNYSGEANVTGLGKISYEPNFTHESTATHVLSLLISSPKTARQIQYEIQRSREHTSRLMKKLTAEGVVRRDETIKPFSYSITDEGRKLLTVTSH